ncbi:hypothetical protein AB4851_30180 [Burkholderia sp. 22PA0099]|uniref:hypothetical protein n=1 Tax=Burkholderia sp. 22PA0099 TaxID=3237372 RepID=UPI0039C4900B
MPSLTLTVSLSLSLCHFFRLPWTDAMVSRKRGVAIAADYFGLHFTSGSSASAVTDAYTFVVEDAPPGRPRLVFAMDRALQTEIAAMSARMGARLTSLTPWIVLAVNQHSQLLPEHGWLGVVETGRVGLVLFEDKLVADLATVSRFMPTESNQSIGKTTEEEWRSTLIAMERRTRLRRACPAGLPMAVLDLSSYQSEICSADVTTTVLSHCSEPAALLAPVDAADMMPRVSLAMEGGI